MGYPNQRKVMPQAPHPHKHFTGKKQPIRSAWQTVVVGALAAVAAFVLAKMVSP